MRYVLITCVIDLLSNQPNHSHPIIYHYNVSLLSGMRILVTLLLDTLPMLGNVLLLCFFVFFIFGKFKLKMCLEAWW